MTRRTWQHRMSARSQTLMLAAAAVLLTAAGTAAYAQASSSSPASSLQLASLSGSAISAVSPAQAKSFAVLERSQRPGDAFGFGHAGPFGSNPALARAVSVPRSELSSGDVWVVPAAESMCLRVLDPAGGDGWVCAGIAEAREGGLIGALRPPGNLSAGEAFIQGLAPNGVALVTITLGNGARLSLPVNENVYATTVVDPVSATFTEPDGTVRTVPVP